MVRVPILTVGGIVLLATTLPLRAQRISVEQAPELEVGAYETYVLMLDDHDGTLSEFPSALRERVFDALREQLNDHLREDPARPDLLVRLQVTFREEPVHHRFARDVSRQDRCPAVDYPSSTYRIGTMTLRFLDEARSSRVWQGTAEGTISYDPERAVRKLEKGIGKLVQRWRRSSGNAG